MRARSIPSSATAASPLESHRSRCSTVSGHDRRRPIRGPAGEGGRKVTSKSTSAPVAPPNTPSDATSRPCSTKISTARARAASALCDARPLICCTSPVSVSRSVTGASTPREAISVGSGRSPSPATATASVPSALQSSAGISSRGSSSSRASIFSSGSLICRRCAARGQRRASVETVGEGSPVGDSHHPGTIPTDQVSAAVSHRRSQVKG